ncbi:MAG: type II toxin-antitoxin system VapC family toxin [Candidatus Aminicenantes bacterium]|nr:MAG: type II toxin-antitoxin system VapC family toxin [Candidatus Aminicenantes bacterium]
MKLIDSNIIIYSGANENSWLRELFYESNSFFSSISKIEVLGFQQIIEEQVIYFTEVFKLLKVLPVDSEVIDKAVSLRQQRKLTLGDAIIAATALLNNLTLVTRNVDDFSHIPNLNIDNPFNRT